MDDTPDTNQDEEATVPHTEHPPQPFSATTTPAEADRLLDGWLHELISHIPQPQDSSSTTTTHTESDRLLEIWLRDLIPPADERDRMHRMQCGICREPLLGASQAEEITLETQDEDVPGEHDPVVLPCSPIHSFHLGCIRLWMTDHGDCPYDRVSH